MDITSAILLFGAALAGLFLMRHLSGDMPVPGTLFMVHVSLTVLGILAWLMASGRWKAWDKWPPAVWSRLHFSALLLEAQQEA